MALGRRLFSTSPAQFLLILACVFPWQNESAGQQVKPPAEWLPASSVAYWQIHDIGKVWREIESSPIVQELLKLPDIQKAMENPQFRQAMFGKKFVEDLVGQDLKELAQDLTENAAWLAIDDHREVAIIFSPRPETYERLQKLVGEFVTLGSFSKDGPAIRAVTYKGISAFSMDKARMAFHAGRIVLCSGNSIGKSVLDRALGETDESLSKANWFQATQKHRPAPKGNSSTFEGAVNVKWLRETGQWKLPVGQEIAPELLVGGVMDVLQNADLLTMAADWNGMNLDVRLCVPMPESLPENRQYFFGQGELAASPKPLDLQDRILSVRWHRDIGDFWKMIPQIIKDENALAEVAKSESEIATLFGGMITVGDMFDYLGPDVELVACQPKFSGDGAEEPEIKLPRFGIVGALRDSQRADRALRLAFQQVASLSNLNAGAGKYPPVEVTSEKVGSVRYLTASYLQLDTMKMSGAESPDDSASSNLYLNFSPTLAIDGDRFVLTSDREFAEQLLNGKSTAETNVAGVDNSVIELWPQALVDLARTNFEPLVAQRMLETGKDREAAVSELEIGLTVVRCLERVRLSLTTENGNLVLHGLARLAVK